MEETYKLKVEDNESETFQKELNEQIKKLFFIKKIKLMCRKEIIFEDLKEINIFINDLYLFIIKDNLIYYNNIIEINFCPLVIPYLEDIDILLNDKKIYFFNMNFDIDEIELTIKKENIIVNNSENYNNNNLKLNIIYKDNKTILSNYFNTFIELQNYFINLTDLNEDIFNKHLEEYFNDSNIMFLKKLN